MSALKRVVRELLTDEAVKCAREHASRKEIAKVIDSAVKLS
jgi:hypothetical protein